MWVVVVVLFVHACSACQVWFGVPYATVPERFAPAVEVPLDLSHAVRGPSCPQTPNSVFPAESIQSEQCLNLNVFSPGEKFSLPVAVFLHGGGFQYGGTAPYDACSGLVSRANIVVVNVNYRLGLFGFFAHPNISAVNVGLYDQRLALQFVRRHAARFGGDPNRITVFGESAGGASTLYHLASPASAALVSRGIAQSPGPWIAFPRRLAEATHASVLSTIGCRTLQCAKDMDFAKFAALTAKFPALPVGDGDMVPLLRAGDPFAPYYPLTDATLLRPLLIGDNADEGALFLYLERNSSMVDRAEFDLIMQRYFPGMSAAIEAAYSVPPSSPNYFSILSQILGDSFAYCGVPMLASANADVSRYVFTQRTRDWQFGFLNSCTHAAELPYIFLGSSVFNANLSGEETKVALQMIDRWGTFVAGAKPPTGVEVFGFDAVPPQLYGACGFWKKVFSSSM